MESKHTKDAIYICRLMFGQAVLELLADKQPVTHAILEEKIKAMLPDSQPQFIYNIAMNLLKHHIH